MSVLFRTNVARRLSLGFTKIDLFCEGGHAHWIIVVFLYVNVKLVQIQLWDSRSFWFDVFPCHLLWLFSRRISCLRVRLLGI